ncbi:anti-sigma factor [Sagittula sp. S175]|uniref:anti-sigma factor n=1 Tax=Sagittula sp. S175 TaxID=3415129 RepID=UPI003C7987E6
MTDRDHTDDDAVLAAEYVLRLLPPEEARAVDARLMTDTRLQALIHGWEMHFAGIAEDVPDVMPPARVKSSILSALGHTPRPRRKLLRRPGFLGSLVAAGLAGVLLAWVLFLRPPDLTPAFRAELASADQSVMLTASVIPATHEIVVEPVAGQPPEGSIFELWLIAEGAPAPISLGLLETGTTTRIVVPDDIAPSVRPGTIAISVEPPGGSPTGAPTGDIVATATFFDL